VTEGSAEQESASWRPRRYRTGRADLDQRIVELLDASGAPVVHWDHLFEILVTALGLGGDDVDRLDLKITNAAVRSRRRRSSARLVPFPRTRSIYRPESWRPSSPQRGGWS
jgi:hypothetical protein